MSEWIWIDTLTRQFELCEASAGRDVVLLAQSTTPQSMIDTAGIALQRTGAASSTIIVPAQLASSKDLPASVRHALAQADMVIDCTSTGVGNLGDTDVLVIGSRSPAGIERFAPHPGLEERARRGVAMFTDSSQCVVSSSAGTNLSIELADAEVQGSWGCPRWDRRIDKWPSGYVSSSFLDRSSGPDPTSGLLVLMPGDVNVTLQELIHSPVTLTIEEGQISDIAGESGDADGLRAVLESADRKDAYRLTGVTIGLNHALAVKQPFASDEPRDETSLLSSGQVTIGFGETEDAPPVLRVGLRNVSLQVGAVTAVANGKLASELAPDVYEIAATAH